jgi:folate-dependent phosphoribosylglycinamide formyltransferase PurN
MKILILTSYTIANTYVVNYLTIKKNIIAKVIEKKRNPTSYKEKMDIRRKMIKKYGVFRALNKLLFNKYKSIFLNKKDDGILKNILFGSDEVKFTQNIPTIEVEDINGEKCVDFISKYNPDVIAVCGTSVIKPDVFRLSRKGTINIHCGITPDYRSADPIFWALYNNEPDKVGVTIHFVDKGIDTGDIIYQKAVGVTKDNNLATLYCKCIKTGADLMVKAIDDIERGEVKTIKKDKKLGKVYYHMDLGIWEYIGFRRRFKKLKSKL